MRTFTVTQAAQELQVSTALIYGLVAAGEIEHERHGLGRGRIRITEAALSAYRLTRTRKAKGESAPPPPSRQPVTLKHLRLRS